MHLKAINTEVMTFLRIGTREESYPRPKKKILKKEI